MSYPWTDDSLLSNYRFKNVYKATNTREQCLIIEIIPFSEKNRAETFFRLLVFKPVADCELFHQYEIDNGPVTIKNFNTERYIKSFPKCGREWLTKYLKLVHRSIANDLFQDIGKLKSMEDVCTSLARNLVLTEYQAYQLAIELNYSDIINFSEMEYVVASKRACDGMKKCFPDLEGNSPEEIIRMMTENQDKEFKRFGLEFQDLYGRKIQLVDCENIFREIEIYFYLQDVQMQIYASIQKFDPTSKSSKNRILKFPSKWNIG